MMDDGICKHAIKPMTAKPPTATVVKQGVKEEEKVKKLLYCVMDLAILGRKALHFISKCFILF